MFRRALLAVVLTTAASLFALSTPAQARFCMLDHYCVLAFYSDSTHTTLVGTQVTDCTGEVFKYGRRSAHQEFTETPC